jgi:hypothetical protein
VVELVINPNIIDSRARASLKNFHLS